jgi:hypothetical protein
MSGDYETVLELAATAARIKVAHARFASAALAIYEFLPPMRTRSANRSWPALATRVDGATPQSERYARTHACISTSRLSTHRYNVRGDVPGR